MDETHIMKFLQREGDKGGKGGIRTFPHQTYGVSKDSPDHFHQKHTLVGHNSYQYRHEHAPEFEYHSQKRSHVLTHHPHTPNTLNPHTHSHSNPYRFHLKKGRLTEFLDKNAWMNTVCLLSGHERSEKARSLCNRDRQEKIQSFREKPEYENTAFKKPIVNQGYYNTLSDLMSERVRIRTRRNKEAEKQVPLTQRTISQIRVGELENQNIRTKMSQTTQEWYPALKGDRERKITRDLSFRQPKVGNLEDHFPNESQNLEVWQRKTCNSKWNFKMEKMDTNEEDNIEFPQHPQLI